MPGVHFWVTTYVHITHTSDAVIFVHLGRCSRSPCAVSLPSDAMPPPLPPEEGFEENVVPEVRKSQTSCGVSALKYTNSYSENKSALIIEDNVALYSSSGDDSGDDY